MIGMLGVLLGIGWAKAETLTCAGATLSLQSCSDGVVNIDCGAQTSCTVAARLQLTSGSCVVQRVGSCEVTVVGSSSANPAFLINTDPSKSASLILRDIQPQCGHPSFVFVEPDKYAKATTVTFEGLRATTPCSKNGPLLTSINGTGTPSSIAVTITNSVLTGWTSEGWDSSDPDSAKEGGLISLDNTALTITGSVLADNTLYTTSTTTGGGFISASGASSVLTLTDNLFVLSNAATQDLQGTMFRLAAEAKATFNHNVFIDKAGVTADYAPLFHILGDSELTLNHNLFFGAGSSRPIGTGDGSIPSLNHNLFVGPTSPWDLTTTGDSGTLALDPNGENNWAQAGVTDDLGESLSLDDLKLIRLSTLWADLYPNETAPTAPFADLYDAIDLSALPIWPDSCSPLLGLDTFPGVLGGGNETWTSALDVTTAYDVTWYCSTTTQDGDVCFEENADHCTARAEEGTCKTERIRGDFCNPHKFTDTGDSDIPDDTGEQSGRYVGTWFSTVRMAYQANGCGGSSSKNTAAAAVPLLALLALVSRRRRR